MKEDPKGWMKCDGNAKLVRPYSTRKSCGEVVAKLWLSCGLTWEGSRKGTESYGE